MKNSTLPPKKQNLAKEPAFSKGGRPTVMTPDVLTKCEQAFAMGCSDIEACLFAGISPRALYLYQGKNPLFTERKRQLKQTPVLKARATIWEKLDDVATAKWFLERKCAQEFGTKTKEEIAETNAVCEIATYSDEELEKIVATATAFFDGEESV